MERPSHLVDPDLSHSKGLLVRNSPSQLQLQILMVAAGVLFTCWQLEAISSWRPTVTVHLSMGLVAVGAFLTVIPTFSRKSGPDR